MCLTRHLQCSGLKRIEKPALAEQHCRKAVRKPSLIIPSFLTIDRLDPQVSTNLFMTQA